MMIIRLITLSDARQLIKIYICRISKLLDAHCPIGGSEIDFASVLLIDI